MPVGADLRSGFGTDADGNTFDLTAALGGVGDVIQVIGPSLGGVDTAGLTTSLGGVTAQVDGADTSGVVATAAASGGRALGELAALPGAGDVLRPVLLVLETVETVAAGDVGAMLTSLRQAATATPGDEATGQTGVRALTASLGAALGGLRAGTPAGALLQQLLALLPGAQGAATAVDKAATATSGVQELVEIAGGLMALKTCIDDVDLASRRIEGFLALPAARAAVARARGVARRGNVLARQVRDAATRPALAEAAGRDVADMVLAYRALADVLVAGMAQGEATIVDSDLGAISAEIDVAKAALAATRGDALRDLTLDLQAKARAALPPAAGPERASLDAFWDDATAFVTPLVQLVQAIPVDQITGPVSGAIGRVTGVVNDLNRGLAEVQGTIRGVFEQARQLVDALDTRALAEAIRAFLQPVVDAVEALERIVGDAVAAFTGALNTLTGQIEDVVTALETLATAVTAAFQRVADVIDGLHIEDLVEGLRTGVTEAANAIGRVQIRPYFDTAIDVMGTTVQVIDAVPLAALPDQQKQELADRTQPILQINFDVQVRQVLIGELDAILADLQTDVLGDVQGALDDVAEFLTEVNPRTHLEAFEREHFDPLIARLRALDPDELLRPAREAIDRVRARIAGLDLRGEVLGAIEEVFDDLLTRFDALNPAQLLVPIEQRVDEVKAQISQLIRLDDWMAHVDTLSGAANAWLDRIDMAAAAERLETVHDQWLAAAQGASGAVIGGIVASLVGSLGYRVRASAYGPVAGWIGGADGAAEVRAALGVARARLEAARAGVDELDLAALAGELAGGHREVTIAVSELPDDSPLKLRVSADLAAVNPVVTLGAMAQNQQRYLTRLGEAVATVRALEGGGFSQITAAAQSAREGLRPLAAIKDQLVSYLRRFGIDAVGKDLRTILREVFAILRPARALAPLVPLVVAARDKVRTLLVDGLVTPVRAGVTEVRAVFDAIDLTPLREGLDALHAQIRAEIEAFRPSVILDDLLTAVESLQARLVDFDPLAPIRVTVNALKTAIDRLAQTFRPTVLLAPALDTYDRVLGLIDRLDVRNLFGPVLDALSDIQAQLDEGLQGTGEVFVNLQRVLGEISAGGGAGGSIGGSIGTPS